MMNRTEGVRVWLSDEAIQLLQQLAYHLETSMSQVVALALQRAINENEATTK